MQLGLFNKNFSTPCAPGIIFPVVQERKPKVGGLTGSISHIHSWRFKPRLVWIQTSCFSFKIFLMESTGGTLVSKTTWVLSERSMTCHLHAAPRTYYPKSSLYSPPKSPLCPLPRSYLPFPTTTDAVCIHVGFFLPNPFTFSPQPLNPTPL